MKIRRIFTARARVARLCGLAVSALCLAQVPDAAFAQTERPAARESTINLSIAPGSLDKALQKFAEVAGLQLVYAPELVAGFESRGLSGTFPPREVLDRLLAGTGLSYRFVNERTVTLERAAKEGPRMLGPVRVEGAHSNAAAGVNGSTDATATEGTRSYTSSALSITSKMPLSMRETPQSVSVVTQQRMRDQNLNDFTSVMNQSTGVTLVQGSTNLGTSFYSRGFLIANISVDGGAPLVTGFGYSPQIDMAQYDHIEILRGADGLFNSYGDPSGTVNLVRKKPLDHNQVTLEGSSGSWSNYRAVVDATGPLAFDGKLRGRMVFTYQDNDHFYDLANDKRTMAYGVLQYDVTPSTLVTGGISYTAQDSLPWRAGLPRYQNGDDLGLARDTCLCFPWNRYSLDTTELFASVEQQLGEAWTLKFNLTHNDQNNVGKIGASSGSVNPLTGAGPTLAGVTQKNASKQLSEELTLTGSFNVLGQRQQVLVGFNHADPDGGGLMGYSDLIPTTYVPYPGAPTGRPPINVFSFDRGNLLYQEPPAALPSLRYLDMGEEQSGAFLNLRLTAFDRLHLVTGVRYSNFVYHRSYDSFCTSTTGSCAGKSIGDISAPTRVTWYRDHYVDWPPHVSLIYDVSKTLSAYVGYTDISKAYGDYLTKDLTPIDPVTGSNREVGLKWESLDGKLNASLSAYYIQQKNYPISDLSTQVVETDPNTGAIQTYYVASDGSRYLNGALPDGQHACCFVSDPNQIYLSKGVDAEFGGQLLPGWQISAGYTYSKNEYKGLHFGAQQGTPFFSQQPENLLKVWTTYALPGTAWFNGLTVGGGVNAMSKAYYSGSSCVDINPPNAQGISTCKRSVPYQFTQPAYAVLSGRVDYKLNKAWGVALNVNNLTDKRYYQTTGGPDSGNWYGEPRSYALTLRGAF